MRNTKIEWADMTWNPISGCYGDCPYCYARQIANRFQFRRDCILTACDGSPLDSSKDLHIREDALNRRRVIELDRAAYHNRGKGSSSLPLRVYSYIPQGQVGRTDAYPRELQRYFRLLHGGPLCPLGPGQLD